MNGTQCFCARQMESVQCCRCYSTLFLSFSYYVALACFRLASLNGTHQYFHLFVCLCHLFNGNEMNFDVCVSFHSRAMAVLSARFIVIVVRMAIRRYMCVGRNCTSIQSSAKLICRLIIQCDAYYPKSIIWRYCCIECISHQLTWKKIAQNLPNPFG